MKRMNDLYSGPPDDEAAAWIQLAIEAKYAEAARRHNRYLLEHYVAKGYCRNVQRAAETIKALAW